MAPNAEDMIRANQARLSPELRAASLRPIDYEASQEMDEGEAQGFVEGEGQVVSWNVRGPFVVVVVEDDDGHLRKEAHTRKGQEKQAERAMSRGGQEMGRQRMEAGGPQAGATADEAAPEGRQRRTRPS
jgi:hypothetical protein